MVEKASRRYIALLRGINVGGNNIIRMADLKQSFEELGFSEVTTYIQSGNVLFNSSEGDKQLLTEKIEAHLSERFAYQSKIVLVTQDQLRQIVESAPQGFGEEPGEYRYNVLFLKEPLTAEEAMQSITIREGVDRVWAGEEVLYFSVLTSRATQSRLSRIVGQPIYQWITIRNWNTTTKMTTM